MIAKIGIYEDCTKAEPTKVYECHRLLFGVSKKALALAERAEGKTEAEQEGVMVEMLQAIFPDFEANELDFVDPEELGALIEALQRRSSAEAGRVEKN